MNKASALFIVLAIMLIGSLFLSVPPGASYLPGATAILEGDCYATPFDVDRLDTATGQLLFDVYLPDEQQWRLFSTGDNNALSERSVRHAAISPNGLWIADVGLYDDTLSLIVQEINGNERYLIFIQDEASARQLHWLNDHEILTVFQPVGVTPAEWYASEVINPFTGERQAVLPTHLTSGWISTTPIFPDTHDGEYFDVSPNGRYVMFQDLLFEGKKGTILYDIENSTTTPVAHLSRPWIWSSNSSQLAFFGRDLSAPDNTRKILVYDIEQGSTIPLINLNLEPNEYVQLFDRESWSPDGNYLAFMRGRWNEPYYLNVLHIPSGEVIEICLVEPGEASKAAWSRDSRYLAFDGVIIQDKEVKTEGIYIFDIRQSLLFKLHEGPAEIIGWASLE